mgnify:FL=1
MKVNAKFFASVREITGKREELVELKDGATVEELLKILVERFGKKFREYVFDVKTNSPRNNLQFLMDGRSVTTMNGLQTKLYEGCQFAIIPPVGGG